MKHFIIFSITILACFFSHAQENGIQGSIESWSHGNALIIGDGKKVLGNVQDNGTFIMHLKGEPGVSYLSNWFSCPGTDLESSNLEQTVGFLAISGAFIVKASEKDRFSIATMVPSSSQEFAKFVAYRGRLNAVTGYSVNFCYVEQPASLKGVCERNRKNGKERIQTSRNYNLDFKPGWNMVLFEIKEVFTDPAGNTHPKVINYQTIDQIPETLKYHIILTTQKYN